ncbi:cytochrome P450 monooxygenase oxidoreductase [Fusarium subglutinans]|uniref:Cytochrome P450 monooxygenase oxidoreductase n=1 Tax=Gibberella subglutinans TaxID=42677 RepID=A0A8H5PUI0_GIBSU|nr:cytochrome P450 monooxygenase oxidoreductase [Fusarium subglutinans]KAF5602864.1 cytochrome P450 monooxygenase oxidoreductase [Fusarium subglutinans]
MATKQFFILGEAPSTARDVELPSDVDFEELQNIVASHFAIVKPNGVGFVHDDRRLNAISEVLEKDDPIAVSINGNAVRDVPGPAGIPYFGNYFEIYPDHLGNNQRLFEKYGPLFVTNSMGNRLYQTNSAELSNIFLSEDDYFTKDIVPGHPLHPIKNPEAGVFLSDTNTEQWRLAHKFLPPALGPKAVRHYAPTMQKTVEQSFKVFDELDDKGEAWNVYQYMLKLGSQAVGKLVLGMDFAHFEEVDSPLHEMVLKIAENLELNKRVSSMGAWYAKMPFGDPKKVRDTGDRIMEMMTESIARASKGQEDLELQDAALKAENVVDYFLRAKDNKGSKLPPSQFAPTLLVATGAGFTTTSSLLSWLIYSLVKYPGNQERLLQELIDNDWDEDTQVTADTTSKLNFLDKFIKETQRLHNPSFQPARTSKVDMILPGGYRLPKGAVVISALHHMHNNKDVWENPGRFDPDRWDTEQVKNRPPGSYIPFAAGPRMCVGFNFALQEIKVFLPKLVYRYKFSLAQDGPIDYDPYFQLIRPNNFLYPLFTTVPDRLAESWDNRAHLLSNPRRRLSVIFPLAQSPVGRFVRNGLCGRRGYCGDQMNPSYSLDSDRLVQKDECMEIHGEGRGSSAAMARTKGAAGREPICRSWIWTRRTGGVPILLESILLLLFASAVSPLPAGGGGPQHGLDTRAIETQMVTAAQTDEVTSTDIAQVTQSAVVQVTQQVTQRITSTVTATIYMTSTTDMTSIATIQITEQLPTTVTVTSTFLSRPIVVPKFANSVLKRVKRAAQVGNKVPAYLPLKGASDVSSACSCHITNKPAAPATTTIKALEAKTFTSTVKSFTKVYYKTTNYVTVTSQRTISITDFKTTTKTDYNTVTITDLQSFMVTQPVIITVTEVEIVTVTNVNTVDVTNYNTIYTTDVDTALTTDLETVIATDVEYLTATDYQTVAITITSAAIVTPNPVFVTVPGGTTYG